MASPSMIERADLQEELEAGLAMNLAKSKEELISVWNTQAEHFTGDARARLQLAYAEALSRFVPLSRAG